jgi:adenylate kinase
MNVLVFGAQGSGKSTYGQYIASSLKVPYIYTGDLFRRLENEDSERGRLIKNLLDQGLMIPDEVAIPAFEDFISQFDISKGVVLDGFPRTVHQAETLKLNIDLVISIVLEESLAIERLLKRKRYDDTPELIKKRIALYKERTQPVLDFFEGTGVKIVEIDNSPHIEEVKRKIDDLFKV